jgi:metaxin
MTSAAAAPAPSEPRGWFAVPAPVRDLFKSFPLHVYPPEPLPLRAAAETARPRLFVFSSPADARAGLPSFNPSCLKWQTLLRIAGVDVELVPSNNHASPSGALPFLLSQTLPSPLTGSRIGQYAKKVAPEALKDQPHARLDAYQALLTQSVRPAWLYTLYLLPANDPLLTELYLPSSAVLQLPVRHSLHEAATTEILKTTRRATISPDQLYSDATTAFRALSTLLGDHDWFFGSSHPSAFDADAFAYTHLILDANMDWRDDRLAECLAPFENLVRHRKKLYQRCWPEAQQ